MPLRRSLRGRNHKKGSRAGKWLALAAVPAAAAGLAAGALVAALAFGAAVVFAATSAYFQDLPPLDDLAAYQGTLFQSSTIYARDGTLLGELVDEGRRRVVPSDQIPQLIKDATIAAEDASFYDNPGVDLRAVLRAVWLNLQGGTIVSGFSTITQQVVKNTLLTPEISVERKLREVALAYQLSQRLTKDEILGLYLNQNFYGNRAYGIAAAAETYFGKDLPDLSLAEVAMLAGIPRAPSTQNPLANEAAALTSQHRVLDLMAKNLLITREQAEAAKGETLQYRASRASLGPAPHFFNYVVDFLQDKYGSEISKKGWRITTSLDPALQAKSQAVAREHVATLANLDVGNAAAVVLEPSTGQILAMVGSIDFENKDIDGQVNMALAPRQPGSAFKPFTYITALAKGYTAATLIYDIKTVIPIPNQKPYEPANFDDKFHGPVRLRVALGSSFNIPAVRAQLFAGIPETLETARRMGLTISGGPERFGPSLVLGSAEVPLLDLAAAYGVFANQGLYVEPNPILRIEDSKGNVVEATPPLAGRRVLSRELSYLMTSILSDAKARIPGFGQNVNMSLDSRPSAIKTGTTTDYRDALAVGYTPDRVTAVWAGNADNAPTKRLAGVQGASPIWRRVMLAAHDGLPIRQFPRPEGLVEAEIDAVSGLLPGLYTPQRINETFIPGAVPTRRDFIHQPIPIHKLTGKRAGPSTPPNEVDAKAFPVLPPEAEAWQRSQPKSSPFYLPTEEVATALDSPQPLPDVVIAIPAQDQHVRSILEIKGNAQGPGFLNYLLEFGSGSTPSEWLRIGEPVAEPRNRAQLGVVDTIQLQDGVYTLRLTVQRQDGQIESALRRIVVDNTPPSVAFSGLQPGSTLPRGQLAFQVDAVDNARIASVTYSIDGQFVATAHNPPYRVTWDSLSGAHELRAVATDAAGNHKETEPLPFRVP